MVEKQWCPGCSREVEGVCHHFNCAIGPNGLDAQSRSSAATEDALEETKGRIARAIYDVSNRWVAGNFPEGHEFRDFSQVDERTCNLHFDYAEAVLSVLPDSCGAESNRHSGAVGAEKRAEQSNPGGGHEVTEGNAHTTSAKPLPDEPTPAVGRDGLAQGTLSRSAILEEAARVAENGCLVPPDGGSPTEDEREMCESIAARIRLLKLKGAEEVFEPLHCSSSAGTDAAVEELAEFLCDEYEGEIGSFCSFNIETKDRWRDLVRAMLARIPAQPQSPLDRVHVATAIYNTRRRMYADRVDFSELFPSAQQPYLEEADAVLALSRPHHSTGEA